MILPVLLIILVAGGAASWAAGRVSASAARWVALAATSGYLLLASLAALTHRAAITGWPAWVAEYRVPWVPSLGVSFHLAADGLSLVLVVLTGVMGIVAIVASWTEITDRVGFFHFQLLLVLGGVTGVFLAADLFLFYLCWELMLVPMYFLIALWGHELRRRAAVKFLLFTQAGGLLMLLAIAALYVRTGVLTGTYTFEYTLLLGSRATIAAPLWLVLGFVLAFGVKLPVLPLHPWLPDAHTEAPTAGSVVLAGLLLKTGAYGFLRVVLPLFPHQASSMSLVMVWIGVAGVLYGSMLSFAQRDLKRLVAYTSIAHMGFVLIGIFSGTSLGLTGAVLEIVCHALSTGALFFIAGAIGERSGTRDMGHLGGLLAIWPRMNALTLVFLMASIGLPGLGNFVAEFLIIAGVFALSPGVAALAASGMVLSVVYGTWFAYRVFQGPQQASASLESRRAPDLRAREVALLGVLAIALLWIGLYPQPLMDAYQPGAPRAQATVQSMDIAGRVTK